MRGEAHLGEIVKEGQVLCLYLGALGWSALHPAVVEAAAVGLPSAEHLLQLLPAAEL